MEENFFPLFNVKSKYILKKIFENVKQIKYLNILRYNKSLQKRMNITLDNFIKCQNIEIKIVP